jgi:hypothetical protein
MLGMNQMSARFLLMLLALCLIGVSGCAGEVAKPDSSQAADTLYVPPDLFTGSDYQKPTDQFVVPPDGTPKPQDGPQTPSDGAPTPADSGTLDPPCNSWSAWTCAPDQKFLCKASCTAAAKQYLLTCTSTGHCVCGVAGAPCGPYTYTQPCDACKQAMEDNCCLP